MTRRSGIHDWSRDVRGARSAGSPVRIGASRPRLLVVGTGAPRANLLAALRLAEDVEVVGILEPSVTVDGDQSAGGHREGVPLLGALTSLNEIAIRASADGVILTEPLSSREQMRQLIRECATLRLDVAVVATSETPDNAAAMQLRGLDIADLMGRRQRSIDLAPVRSHLRGKTVLITGGAGSIGSEFARQVAALGAARVVLLDKSESALFLLQHELRHAFPDVPIDVHIADVTNARRIESVFAACHPDMVLHTAAFKHVPLLEHHLEEAVRTNVEGTFITARASMRHGVGQFVLLSTDKAVYPSSVMGASKRVAELVISDLAHEGGVTDFRTVRLGNVLDSAGSAVPLFRRQIELGAAVTVTDADASRYFIANGDAVSLMLLACTAQDAAGRMVVLEMGDPVRILELAEDVIHLSGRLPRTQVPIEFVGLRPGEKLHESLESSLECSAPSTVRGIRILQPTREHLANGERIQALLAALDIDDSERLLQRLIALVPECIPPLRDRAARS